jgi:hypothetical protein
MRARRPLLAFMLGAIAVTAVLGLWAVLSSDFGELQGKVLATSAAISVASILGLACAPAAERRLLMPLPAVAAGLVVVALVMLVIGIWKEELGDDYWFTFWTVLLLAAWGVLVSLLVLARLAPRYSWTFYAATGLTMVLTVFGIVALWDGSSSDAFARVAGAVAVLSAAFVLAVPVLSRASRSEVVEAAPAAFCPRCGRKLDAGAPEGPCPGCGARFRVRFLS